MAAEIFTIIGLATVALLGVVRWWEEHQLYREPVELTGIAVFAALALSVLAALALLLLQRDPWRTRAATVVTALLSLLVVTMTVYVVAAEGYVNDGRTVWEVSNGGHRALLIVAIATTAAFAGLATMRIRRHGRTMWLVPVTGVAVILNYLAVVSTVE